MTGGVITMAIPGRPDGVMVDPPHCAFYIERHYFASPDLYHYDERARTWELVRVIDRRKYL